MLTRVLLPLWFLEQRVSSIRICVDYSRLNEVAVKDAFPLPHIHDALDALAGAGNFSLLDLAPG